MHDHGWVGPVEWAAAGHPAPGEGKSGDSYVVAESGSCALLAVIDGLGHGGPAAVAAERAAEVLQAHPTEPLDALIRRCHVALATTRGVVFTLALIDPGIARMCWFGVGNVVGSLVRMAPGGPTVHANAMLHGGIVGHKLPKSLRQVDTALQLGDLVLLGTDGLVSSFDENPDLRQPADVLAADILRRSATGADDALVLVTRYRGASQ